MDIIVIIILTVAAVPVVELTHGLLRIILGVVVLLVFPGYVLTEALFPAKKSLGGVERAGMTFALSIAVVSLGGLALNYTPWGITLTPVLVTALVLILVPGGVALFRRTRMPASERPVPRAHVGWAWWRSANRLDKALYITLAVVVAGSLATLSYVIARPKHLEGFTNFYLLGPEGKMENYPSLITQGEARVVTVCVTNHENRPASYVVSVSFNGDVVQTIGPLELDNGSDWSEPVTLTPPRVGDNQTVEFTLFKDQASRPYLNLRLWLDVSK